MSRRRGFTLIETFIAIALLATVFLALASVYPVSVGSLRKSSHLEVADNLARHYLEAWRTKDFPTLHAVTVAQNFTDTVDLTDFKTTLTVGDVTPVADPNLLQLDVTVTWAEDSKGGNSSIHYGTCVFNVINPW